MLQKVLFCYSWLDVSAVKIIYTNGAIRCPLRHSRTINICHKAFNRNPCEKNTTYFEALTGKALSGYAIWQRWQVFLKVSRLSEHNMTEERIFHLWFCLTPESSSSEYTDKQNEEGQRAFTSEPVDFNTAATYGTQLGPKGDQSVSVWLCPQLQQSKQCYKLSFDDSYIKNEL